MDIDLDIMDLFIAYAFSDSPLINKKSLMNLRRLITSIQKPDDFELLFRFDVLETILKAMLDKSIYRNNLLKEYCNSKLDYGNLKVILDEYDDDSKTISESEIDYVNEYVEEKLTYIYLYENQDALENALLALKNSSENNMRLSEVNKMFANVIGKLNKDIQMAKANSKYAAMDFSLGGKNLETVVKTTIDNLNKESHFVKTGLQYLNRMLQGGFECGRCYLFCALPKSFKSGLLVNVGLWACKYNKFIPKDPEKVPTILYVTQENSVEETLQRIFTSISGEDINEYSEEKVIELIKEEIIHDRNVDFEIRFRPNKSISTEDLDAMIDDLALEGKEVVMLIHDYTKRIRSSMNYPDIRLELAEVVNDFTMIAKVRNIPVVTAAQLNRKIIAAL